MIKCGFIFVYVSQNHLIMSMRCSDTVSQKDTSRGTGAGIAT